MLWTSSGQTYGARKVRTWIETDMRAQLVQMKLEKKIVENCTVHIDAVAGKDEPDYKVVERSGVLRWKSVKGMMQAVLRSKGAKLVSARARRGCNARSRTACVFSF